MLPISDNVRELCDEAGMIFTETATIGCCMLVRDEYNNYQIFKIDEMENGEIKKFTTPFGIFSQQDDVFRETVEAMRNAIAVFRQHS